MYYEVPKGFLLRIWLIFVIQKTCADTMCRMSPENGNHKVSLETNRHTKINHYTVYIISE